MKKVIAALTFVIAIGQVNALVCSLNKENPKVKNQFDQAIFQGLEVLKNGQKQQVVVVRTDGTVIEDLKLSSLNFQEITALDKSIVAFIAQNDDKTLVIGTGSVDMSKPQDFIKADALAMGSENKMVSITNYASKLTLSCF